MNGRKRIRWIVLGVALAMAGLHVWVYGSPLPLWNVERLNAPVFVRSVTSNQLILEDGRTISLPLIKELPPDNPMFKEAIKDGIEVGRNGEIYCLIWIDPMAISFPLWQKRRVNLSAQAAVLNPAGLDDSQVNPKFCAHFQQEGGDDRIRTYACQERRLLGCHWSWLNLIQEDLQRNMLINAVVK